VGWGIRLFVWSAVLYNPYSSRQLSNEPERVRFSFRTGGVVVAILAVEVSFWAHLLNAIVIFLALVLIVAILIQRGKGGGLAGAFGAAGGSSAFGSRAGDAFTRITIYLAAIWALCIVIQAKVVNYDKDSAPRSTIGREAQ
jgi:preprotein translocase subunit SecG